jgi:hypothetical protein
MLKKIITAALLIGSSTAALAAPSHGTVVVRDHRVNTEVVRHVTPRPVQLHQEHRRYYDPGYFGYSNPGYYTGYGPTVSLNYASEPTIETYSPSAQFVSLGGLTGNGIELSMVDGPCQIQQLTIFYADGRQVIVPVGSYLDSMRPRINILTETSPIAGISIVGTGNIGAYRS